MSKILYKNYHLSLYETERGFIYAQRRNINSTASLLYKKVKNDYQFLLRYQPLPELRINKKKSGWKTLFPCCVTGSLEIGETPITNCIKEVFEETGYKITKSNIKGSVIAVASTQSNECVYNFIVDITKAKQTSNKLGDGSIFESVSKNVWVSHKRLREILLKNEIYLSSTASAYLLFLDKIYSKEKK